MKKIIPLVLLSTLLIVSWCTKNTNDTTDIQVDTGSTETGTQEEPDVISIWWEQNPGDTAATSDANTTSYQLDMAEGHDTIDIDLQAWDHVIIAIKTVLPQTFFRVSQIVYPDSSMDGPFEDGHTFQITQDGSYQFIVGPNMMASNEVYTGMIDVELSIFR